MKPHQGNKRGRTLSIKLQAICGEHLTNVFEKYLGQICEEAFGKPSPPLPPPMSHQTEIALPLSMASFDRSGTWGKEKKLDPFSESARAGVGSALPFPAPPSQDHCVQICLQSNL